jgi:transketolase
MKLTYVSARELERLRTSDAARTERCAAFAGACRLNTLSMIMEAGSGHIGSSFSAMDIVAWLHLEEMDSRAAAAPRDLYFSSKGHDAPGLYSVLVGLGVLDHSLLRKLRRLGGLPGHPDIGTPYAFTNTGSLGMGISKAKGLVRDARLANEPRRVFVLTGDGELQEGSNWEALMAAGQFGLDSLTLIVDRNRLQQGDRTENTVTLDPLGDRLRAFGWSVGEVDGHDLDALLTTCDRLPRDRGRPTAIVAHTIKGRGVSFMEHRVEWHHRVPTDAELALALAELDGDL